MAKYDPERHTQEWKDYMNSPKVVEQHRKIVERLRIYKQKRRELYERNTRM